MRTGLLLGAAGAVLVTLLLLRPTLSPVYYSYQRAGLIHWCALQLFPPHTICVQQSPPTLPARIVQLQAVSPLTSPPP
jgi:hypothetical protein